MNPPSSSDNQKSKQAMLETHRWWLALMAALLPPWIGPHLDRYLAIGMVLLQAHGEAPDAGFWAIAGIILGVAYLTWFTLLSVMAAWLGRRHRRKDID